MDVFTYHEPLENYPDQEQVLRLWWDNWTRPGWQPRLLGLADARRHPWFEEISDSPWLLKSVNRREYTRACYHRWLALAQVLKENGGAEPALFIDPDVFNFGLPAAEVLPADRLVCLDATLVPCAMRGTAVQFWQFARFFRNCAVLHAYGPKCLAEDLNDQNLFQDFYPNFIRVVPRVTNYDPGHLGPLVHFPFWLTGPDRAAFIGQALDRLANLAPRSP